VFELRAWFVAPAVIIVALTAVVLVLGRSSDSVTVPETNKSMRPAIGSTQTSFAVSAAWHDDPTRGSIVAFVPPGGTTAAVARVVALPGDRIQATKRRYVVNGKPTESRRNSPVQDSSHVIVPRGCVFVLVDGTSGVDSSEVGPIPLWRVLGEIR
jgi:signal peptidase I